MFQLCDEYVQKEGNSIIIEDYEVKACRNTWKYPLMLDGDSLVEILTQKDYVYHVTYEFNNSLYIPEFSKYYKKRKKLMTVYHLSADKVIVYENINIKTIKNNTINFKAATVVKLTLLQYRECKMRFIYNL